MKKLVLATAIIASFAGSFAHAEDKKPDNEYSFNLGVVTDYRYRGVTQTRFNPALQGGADYWNNPTGFYAGTWLSTIQWVKDINNANAGAAGNTGVEWDLYAGKKGDLTKDISYDVGGLAYEYLGNKLGNIPGFANADTFELYGQLGFGPAYIKYSQALTNLFGAPNSKNSSYIDIGANIDIAAGFQLNLHAGHQTVKNATNGSYTDWKLGVTKDFGVVSGSLAYIGANTDDSFYASPANGKNMGKSTVVLSISKTF